MHSHGKKVHYSETTSHSHIDPETKCSIWYILVFFSSFAILIASVDLDEIRGMEKMTRKAYSYMLTKSRGEPWVGTCGARLIENLSNEVLKESNEWTVCVRYHNEVVRQIYRCSR